MFLSLYITNPRKHCTMPTNQCVTHDVMGRMVPRRSDGSQYRHQLTAVILATLRISLGWILVNSLKWSTRTTTHKHALYGSERGTNGR